MYAPPKATALHAPKDGFYIEGRAASALDVTQQARICLAPMRFGAGIKTKLADAAVDLYQNETAWQQAQQQGFDILRHWFRIEQHQTQLIQHISDIHKNLESHRLYNFTGSMLRHHHRSTEFMSRWIEAKNA